MDFLDDRPDDQAARSPLVVYLSVWVSFGLYGIVWLYRTAQLVGSYQPSGPYGRNRLRGFVALFLVIYLLCLVVYVFTDSPDPDEPGPQHLRTIVIWATAIACNALAIFAVWHVSKTIREAQQSRGLDRPIVPAVSIVGYFLWWTCVAYMQHNINRLAAAERRSIT